MATLTKFELAKRIVDGLLREQRDPQPFASRLRRGAPLGLPPQLPVGNGRFLPATDEVLRDVSAYATILRANDRALAQSHSDEEIAAAVGRAFGESFASVDLDQSDEEIIRQTLAAVIETLPTELSPEGYDEEVIYGCWALTGPGTDDLQVGPVRIEARELWLSREECRGRVSSVAARRIRRVWRSASCRTRSPSFDYAKERAIIDTVDKCPTVCSVVTKGLSPKVAERKAALTARLALTTLALSWETPSKALDRMSLRLDGPIHHMDTVSFGPSHTSRLSSSTSKIGGQFVTAEWLTLWPSLGWLIGPIGDALSAYVRPHESFIRPKVNSALFMSLWWFHEACREQASLFAVVKYAASLDALAGGGESRGIRELINARLSIPPDGALMKDGRTTAQVVREIYGDARSRAIHGSSDRHGDDWQSTRRTAETLARLCLTTSCGWLHEHPRLDDLRALRRCED